ncbi:hypothetical protein B0J15DRAFT_518215 [Fusarium solani]|uniref:Ubiquitin carboxyl-terminal hydrolase n=1 Tax=Fusarium solani TaxID=169388 RepID=A0A9P9JRD3_FUSSL|nr:uncharacterized protein B0J15DRAFT_518215 [Fusarium solani]KAH7230396.1 hypothetical protein B0J15DRAFT_518215 [Fusarium solani]
MGYPSVTGKHFIPLESNPTVFTELAHGLGLSPELEFHDVFSLDEPDLLSLIPRPAFALVLVFPTSPNYEANLQQLDKKKPPEYSKSGIDEDVVWFKQTINNACGLYGILHAVTNGAARDFIVPKSHLASLLTSVEPLKNGHLYELDGDRKGLIERRALNQDDNMLSERAFGVILEFIRGVGKDIGFSLLALAPAVN